MNYKRAYVITSSCGVTRSLHLNLNKENPCGPTLNGSALLAFTFALAGRLSLSSITVGGMRARAILHAKDRVPKPKPGSGQR